MIYVNFLYNLTIERKDGKKYEISNKDDNFNILASFQSEKSIEGLSGECKIALNNYFDNLDTKFTVGDAVTFECYFDTHEKYTFSGFIEKFKKDTPFTLFCSNSAFKLKNTRVEKKDWTSTDVKTIIDYATTGITKNYTNFENITLSPFSLKSQSAFKILQRMKEEFGLDIFFDKENVLNVGLRFSNTGKEIDITNLVLIDETEEIQAGENNVLIKAKSFDSSTGNNISAEFGDEGGDIIDKIFINKTASELLQLAEQEHKKYFVKGLKGSITILPTKIVEVGDIVIFKGNSYICKEVETTVTPFRQKIELGQIVAE